MFSIRGAIMRHRLAQQRGNAMPLEQLANIAEVFGMLVVAITLVFLTVQMRQHTKAVHATTTHAVHDQTMKLYKSLSTDASLADLWVRGMHDPVSLSATETARFIAYWHASILPMQNWFYQWREGVLDEAFWSSWSKVITDVYQMPGFKHFWQQRNKYFSDEFRNYMETELFTRKRSADYRPLGAAVDD